MVSVWTETESLARDSCQCPECFDQRTMQRKADTFSINPTLGMTVGEQNDKGFEILWSDHHKSWYSWKWLRGFYAAGRDRRFDNEIAQKLWNSDSMTDDNAPEVEYDDVMDATSRKGMADLTSNIRTHGFCFVANTPVSPEATRRLLESIGPIRNTHYGGFYDFQPDLAKADTAYTNAALDLHTDTTYFSEPAGIQAFHLLSHTPPPGKTAADGNLGGQSILVDGIFAAHRLRKEFNPDFRMLVATKIPWHASGNRDVAIIPDKHYAVLETEKGLVSRIRWNNADRAMLPPATKAGSLYRSMRQWDRVIKRPENQYRFTLEPGRMLIFDNWRILHGRTAFEGNRRICGGYLQRDDFMSRWKLSNFPRHEVVVTNMQT